MRATAILGPANVARSVATFQRLTGAEWTSLIEQADSAVVFGGDGTVHRHLAELVERDLPVLVVPCGSGNDFARALNIRSIRDAASAWRAFASEKTEAQSIDLGIITPTGKSPNPNSPHRDDLENEVAHIPTRTPEKIPASITAQTSTATLQLPTVIEFPSPAKLEKETVGLKLRYFCCVAGVGLDAEINRRANSLPKWWRAHGGYALSAPWEFLRFAPLPIKVSAENLDGQSFRPTTLAAVANAPTYGGGMEIAPRSRLDDGKLDLCVVRAMNPFKLFCLFPTVYFGRHLAFKQVEYSQAECIRIETEWPLDVYADGEYVCQTPVEFTVAKQAIRVIADRE
jgi:diacylglycerol kinase family enzyme